MVRLLVLLLLVLPALGQDTKVIRLSNHLRVENLVLKLTNLNLQAGILKNELEQVIKEERVKQNVPAEYIFNYELLVFQPAAK